MTTVLYSRSGGFAAASPSARIDTAELDAHEARQLERLIDEADFFALPNEMMRPRDRAARHGGVGQDVILHEITVEREEQQHTVRVDDQELPPALEPLVDYLYDAAIQQARQKRGDDSDR
jgi:hypothetical protein